jgi:histidine triad (HIT) family protein
MPGGRCVFCDVAKGAAPSHVVLEDSAFVAFLDHRPLFPGHCLLIPRAHYETLGDAPPEIVAPLFLRARRLARAVERAFVADGSFVALNNRVSQSVPHLHVHVVPRKHRDGLRGFFWPRGRYRDDAEAIGARDALRRALAELEGTDG